MTRKQGAAGTSKRLAVTKADLAETAYRLSDIAIASGKVVTHRVSMAVEAMNDPNFIEHAEFTTMAMEKIEAMADVAEGFFNGMWSMGSALTGLAIGQGSGFAAAALEMGRAKTPIAAFAAQQRWAADSFARATAHTVRMTELFADVASSAVEPVTQPRHRKRPPSRQAIASSSDQTARCYRLLPNSSKLV